MKEIYTIGYSGFKIDDFIKTIKQYNINCVVDARSNPNSKFYVEYNQIGFAEVLKKHHIYYRNYKTEFGARQIDLQYYNNGCLDFELYVKSDSFTDGVNKIEAGIQLGYRFVIMCAEKDPSTCHRSIMVGKYLYEKGYEVKNILSDGTYETQASLEKRLVDCYFPNRHQLTLFNEEMPWDELVRRSYHLRNCEIGYKESDLIEAYAK